MYMHKVDKLMRLALMVFGLFFASINQAVAWSSADHAMDSLEKYLIDLQRNKTPIFVADCYVDDHIKAVLIFQLGNKIGNIFIIYDNVKGKYGALSTARAEVRFNKSNLSIDNIENVSSETMTAVGRYLVAVPFRLLSPDQVDDVYKVAAQLPCSK